MELDDYIKSKNEIPESGPQQGDSCLDPMKSLINEMKTRDIRERKALLYLVIVFGLFLVLYLAGMTGQKGIMRIGYLLLVGGFMLSVLQFYFRFLRQKKISYEAPALDFLKAAERRYAYWPLHERVIDIPLAVLMGMGGGFIVFNSFDKYFPGSPVPVIIFCFFYFAGFLIGYRVGKIQWDKHKRAVYEKTRQLIREFSE